MSEMPNLNKIPDVRKTIFKLVEKNKALKESNNALLDVAHACMLHSDNSDVSRKNIQSRIDIAETLKEKKA